MWKALVVFNTIRPFLEISRWESPFVAAAPLALPILITTMMSGPPVLLPLVPSWWLMLALMSPNSPLPSVVCILVGLDRFVTWVLPCSLLMSRLSVLVLILVSRRALLMLL